MKTLQTVVKPCPRLFEARDAVTPHMRRPQPKLLQKEQIKNPSPTNLLGRKTFAPTPGLNTSAKHSKTWCPDNGARCAVKLSQPLQAAALKATDLVIDHPAPLFDS